MPLVPSELEMDVFLNPGIESYWIGDKKVSSGLGLLSSMSSLVSRTCHPLSWMYHVQVPNCVQGTERYTVSFGKEFGPLGASS